MSLELDSESMKELLEFKKQLTTKNIIKAVIGTLISIGAAGAVIALMKNPVKAAHGLIKLLMAMGIFTLGCKAGDIAETHFKEIVDNVAESWEEYKKDFKEIKEGEKKDATNSESGRHSEQQSEKQGKSADAANNSTEAATSSVWWGRRRKKKAAE